LPEPAKPAGYAWLIETYRLDVPLPPRLAGIASVHHKVETPEWLLLTPRHEPVQTLAAELTFALKWEGVDLAVLKTLFRVAPAGEVAAIIRAAPNGRYTRRIWFLYEWLMATRLDVADVERKRSIVPVLDPDVQCALAGGEVSSRHRIRNNLPGTPAFCPIVRATSRVEHASSRRLNDLVREVIGRTRADVVARAAAFLQLSDSKASFAIENDHPQVHRAHRWARAIARAGTTDVTVPNLVDLQRMVIGDARLVRLGLRSEGGFVGEHDRDTGTPIPEHISARHDDLESLMAGIEEFDARSREHGLDPVVAAASLAFGFVYIHPFEDGNGRLHRWLIHHVLAATGYAPKGMVFPVSTAMLRRMDEYRSVLESYSSELISHVEWRPTERNNVEALNQTADMYRYFDATRHAEFLYDCVAETVDRDLPNEVAYLEAHDRFVRGLEQIIDMPDSEVDLLHRFLRQNGGKLSLRALGREFESLRPAEVALIERLFAETTGRLGE